MQIDPGIYKWLSYYIDLATENDHPPLGHSILLDWGYL